jgi:hypothetical protein
LTPPADESERPGVYARLAEEAEIRHHVHTPPRSARWMGWGICIALCAGVVVGALQANPW